MQGELSRVLDTIAESPFSFTLRLLVAGVLLTAAVVKLRAPQAAAIAMQNFGVVRRARPRYGRLLGLVEASVGLTVLVLRSSPWPAAAAVLLFVAFAVLIARALGRGATFACGCLSSKEDEIGIPTLVRALVLAVVALGASAAPVVGIAPDDIAAAAAGAAALAGIYSLAVTGIRHRTQWTRFVDQGVDWFLAAELRDLPTPKAATGSVPVELVSEPR
jgi:hypothetical protein